jgi:lipoyl(octanoyl) transferase
MDSISWAEIMLISKMNAMRTKETTMYRFANFYRQPQHLKLDTPDCINVRDDLSCRDKICSWTYSVIDHFQLSRQTVAISMDLFDRYLATTGNMCDTNQALLTSLTTLCIAIKINEKKKVKICTVAKLSRDLFTSQDIERMEIKIMKSLSWLVNPPTTCDFISHIIMMLPQTASTQTRHETYEMSRYLAELSVCDPFFVEQDKSTVALATILNVLEDDISSADLPRRSREDFLNYVTRNFTWFAENVSRVNDCRDRLRHLKWEQEERPNGNTDDKRSSSPTSVLNSKGTKR